MMENNSNYTKEEKDKLIKKEINRLKRNYKEIEGTKKSPEVEIYNTMVKNHASIMKQLDDMLPKSAPKQEDDGFEEFVNSK